MSTKHEIEIFITEEGEVKFHLKGIKGAKCVDELKNLASPMGEIKDMTYTSEYYEKEQTTNQIKPKIQ